jgi:hypothetical protein
MVEEGRGRGGRERMVVGFTTTCTISAYRHWCGEFESCLCQGIPDAKLCDICQWLMTGRYFSPGTPVSSTNKTDLHDIAKILFRVALNTINQTNPNQTLGEGKVA